ncbi:MAG: nitrate- and nitrite sensing domain-containing protein [Pacificimonas sp.]
MTMSRLSLRVRIILIAAIPLAGLIALAGHHLLRLHVEALAIEDAVRVIEISPLMGDVTKGLQNERDLSMTLANMDAPDAELMAELTAQRTATDEAGKRLRIAIGNFVREVDNDPEDQRSRLDRLLSETGALTEGYDQTRDLFDRGNSTAAAIGAAYNQPISQGYMVLQSMFLSSRDPEVTRQFTRVAALVHARNRASMERGLGAAIIAGRGAAQRDWVNFFRLRGQQGALFGMADWADPTVVPVRERIDIFADDDLGAMRRELYNKADNLAELGYDAADWYLAASPRIEFLADLRSETFADLSAYVAARRVEVRRDMLHGALAVAALLLLTLVWLHRLIVGIIGNIDAVRTQIEAIAQERFDDIGHSDKMPPEFASLGNAVAAVARAECGRRKAEAEAAKLAQYAAKAEAAERERERADAAEERARFLRTNEEIAQFEKSASEMMRALETSAEELEAAARQLDEIANQTSAQSRSAHVASNEAGRHVSAVSKASEGLAISLKSIHAAMDTTSASAVDTAADALAARKEADDLVAQAERIDLVVQIIDDIARRTNLLALNATIEASSNGGGTKGSRGGFVVIARELKALTRQTGEQADEIRKLVTVSGALSKTVARRIGTVESRSRATAENGQGLAQAIDSHGGAAIEMATSMSAAALSSNTVTSAAESVARIADETRAMSTEMLASARHLGETGSALRGVYERFVGAMRAA